MRSDELIQRLVADATIARQVAAALPQVRKMRAAIERLSAAQKAQDDRLAKLVKGVLNLGEP
jgi:hypothetical protein